GGSGGRVGGGGMGGIGGMGSGWRGSSSGGVGGRGGWSSGSSGMGGMGTGGGSSVSVGSSSSSGIGGMGMASSSGVTVGSSSSGIGGMGMGGAGGGGVGGPACDDTWKRCEHQFNLGDTGQTTVELRGNFPNSGWTIGIPLVKQGNAWSVSTEIPYDKDVQYKFVVNGSTWITDPMNPMQVPDGFGGFNSLLSRMQCDPYTCDKADVWRDEVLYYVFVDRFFDGDTGNNYGSPVGGIDPAASYQGGDWKGVKAKVDAGYFNQMGVTGLVLEIPVDNFEGAGARTGDPHLFSAYHGHWPKDVYQPEEHFGTMAELTSLVTAAHAKGLKVVLEYTANHVHQTAPVYAQNPNWFWPNDNGMGGNCVCGEGCNWGNPAQEERCWLTSYLPDFNHQVAAARSYSIDNMIWWVTQTGADGFKTAAMNLMPISFLNELRSRVRLEIEPSSGKHIYLLGDHFTGIPSTLASRVSSGTMLDGQLDMPLRAEIISKILMRQGGMNELETFMNTNDNNYSGGIMSTLLGIDSVPRVIHFAEDTPLWTNPWLSGSDRTWASQPSLPMGMNAFERLANAFTLLMTTAGIPIIYYGDEIGMPGAGDPDNRRFMMWGNLSAGQTYLRTHLEKLGQIRKMRPALRRGTRTAVYSSAETMAYRMTSTQPADTVYVAINRSDQPNAVMNLPMGALTNLLDGQMVLGPMVMVPPRSSMILVP
ncbi:MAG TPA: alpha-amylase family glycosyl hydrolase, partial [Polyangium sp.]|nr:alpha-amylase family glycosyl hydrolase [Polyangium sp.]